MKRWVSAVLLFILFAAACVVLLLPGPSYSVQDRAAPMADSTGSHWTGTDELGRDRTVRVAAALLLGLAGATLASALTTAVAAAVGLLAAFSHPSLSAVLMMFSDVFLTLPWLFLLMMVRSGLPLTTSPMQSATVTFFILAALGWPACARAVYRGAHTLRSSDWMVYGEACGLRHSRLIRRHLLSHLRPLLLPQFLICIPAFIVSEANLGTLGLGVAEPLPSWGAMLLQLDNSALLSRSQWVFLPIAVLVLVLLLLELFAAEV